MNTVEKFCEHVKNTAQEQGVSFVLSPEAHIPYPTTKDLVNGYMMEFPKKELAVATGKPLELWLPVLAHESSHMDQLIEKDKYWYDSYVAGTTFETIEIVTLWIDRKVELTTLQLDDYVKRSRNVELDCERRTIQKIKDFGLPMDVLEYVQKANSYIFFHTAMKTTRAWYIPGKEPYRVKEVWSLCPKEFLSDDAYEHVPDELMRAFEKILA